MHTKKFVFIVKNSWPNQGTKVKFRIQEFLIDDLMSVMNHEQSCSFYEIGGCNCGKISRDCWKDAAIYLYLNRVDGSSELVMAIPYEEWGGEW